MGKCVNCAYKRIRIFIFQSMIVQIQVNRQDVWELSLMWLTDRIACMPRSLFKNIHVESIKPQDEVFVILLSQDDAYK